MHPRLAHLIALFVCTQLSAATPDKPGPEAGSRAEKKIKVDWSFTPAPALPNVLILGDSISIGYTLEVRKLLAGKANVFRPLSADGSKPENCSGTTAGVQEIDRWLAGHKWDVIHYNWGLHDLKHVTEPGGNKVSAKPEDPVQADEATYGKNLEVIVAKLKATGARLICATTTPVAPGTTNPYRAPDAPARYNAVARKIAEANAAKVNDLFAFCEPELAKLQLPKNVHFTEAGSQALAGKVAEAILAELPAGGKP